MATTLRGWTQAPLTVFAVDDPTAVALAFGGTTSPHLTPAEVAKVAKAVADAQRAPATHPIDPTAGEKPVSMSAAAAAAAAAAAEEKRLDPANIIFTLNVELSTGDVAPLVVTAADVTAVNLDPSARPELAELAAAFGVEHGLTEAETGMIAAELKARLLPNPAAAAGEPVADDGGGGTGHGEGRVEQARPPPLLEPLAAEALITADVTGVGGDSAI